MPTFDDGITRNRKVRIRLPATPVSSGGVSDYTNKLTRACFPGDAAELFDPNSPNAAQANGGDLRITLDDQETQIALNVVGFGHDSDSGAGDAPVELHIGTMSRSSVTDDYVWAWYNTDTPASQPAADAPYGRESAYDSDTAAYWPAGGGTDHTANGYDGTAQGGVTVGGIAGQIGVATEFDGSNDYVAIGQTLLPASGDWTVEAWARNSRADGTESIIFSQYTGGAGRLLLQADRPGNAGKLAIFHGSGAGAIIGPEYPTDRWFRVYFARESGTFSIAIDDGAEVTAFSSANVEQVNNHIGAALFSGSPFGGWPDGIDDVRVSLVKRSSAWRETSFNNENDPASFAIAGTPESTSPAPTFNPAWAAHSNQIIVSAA